MSLVTGTSVNDSAQCIESSGAGTVTQVALPAGRRRAAPALIALLVTGCASRAGRDPTTTPARPGPATAVTQVLTFQAFDDAGLLPNLVRATSVTGTCQGGSLVHPGRADAWRCRAGDTAFDPCFANATADELACIVDPWAVTRPSCARRC